MAQNRVQDEYYCTGRTQESCRKQYLSEHRDLKYVRVPGDGNCFFRSIAAYYRRENKYLDHVHPGIVNPRRYHQLRRYIVQQLGLQIERENYLQGTLKALYNDPKKYRKMRNKNGEISIKKILSKLARQCVWKVPAFDMMVERVPIILNINLIIYKVEGDSSQYYVTKSVYTPYDGAPVPTTISIFLESNHYGLVFPAKDARNAMRESFDQGENESDDEKEDDESDESDDDESDESDDEDEATRALIAEMIAQNERNAENARKASRNAKPSVARNLSRKASYNNIAEIERQFAALEMEAKPSVARNLSRKASYNNIAEIERQFAALEMKAKSSAARNAARNVSRKASRNSSALNNASRQLIYQLYNENEKALHQSSKNNKIASLREQIRQLESASVRRKPSVAQRPIAPSLYNQRNISLRNRQNNAVDCDKLLAPQLREYLKARGYIGPPPLRNIKKPELLSMCRKL